MNGWNGNFWNNYKLQRLIDGVLVKQRKTEIANLLLFGCDAALMASLIMGSLTFWRTRSIRGYEQPSTIFNGWGWMGYSRQQQQFLLQQMLIIRRTSL